MVSPLTDCASNGPRFLTVRLLDMTLLGVKPDRDPFPGVSSIHLEVSLLEEPLTFLLRAVGSQDLVRAKPMLYP